MIIADSDCWIDYWRQPRSAMAGTLDGLIREQRVALVGIVLAELLRGFRQDRERRRANDMLAGLPYIETQRTVWEQAGAIAHQLDRSGQPIPMTDVLIAAIALQGDHEILTRDKHFDRIPGLRLYKPEGASDA